MKVFAQTALAASAIALFSFTNVQPAEAGRVYYCSCKGEVKRRVGGTYACQHYRQNVLKLKVTPFKTGCDLAQWNQFKSHACGQDKCTASDGFAYDAQQAKRR